jgi:hypothetical protein
MVVIAFGVGMIEATTERVYMMKERVAVARAIDLMFVVDIVGVGVALATL